MHLPAYQCCCVTTSFVLWLPSCQVAVPFGSTGLPTAAPPGGKPVAPQLTPGTSVRPAVPSEYAIPLTALETLYGINLR